MNENEPRVPAGQPGGGQWTEGAPLKTPADVAAYVDHRIAGAEQKLHGPGRVSTGPGQHLTDGRRSYHGAQEAYVSPQVDATIHIKDSVTKEFLDQRFSHRDQRTGQIVEPRPEMKQAVKEGTAKLEQAAKRMGLDVEIE